MAEKLSDLSDVYIPPKTNINGQVLTYSNDDGKWEPQTIVRSKWVYISVSITGVMQASEVLMQYTVPEAVVLPGGAPPGTNAVASIATSKNITVVINKNQTQIGTIVWPTGSKIGVFNIPTKIWFVAGDVLQLVAPASPDSNLANIGVTFSGIRGG